MRSDKEGPFRVVAVVSTDLGRRFRELVHSESRTASADLRRYIEQRVNEGRPSAADSR